MARTKTEDINTAEAPENITPSEDVQSALMQDIGVPQDVPNQETPQDISPVKALPGRKVVLVGAGSFSSPAHKLYVKTGVPVEVDGRLAEALVATSLFEYT